MGKICHSCNRQLSFLESRIDIVCAICGKSGCEGCFTYGFKIQENAWKKMHGEKLGRFSSLSTDLIEKYVCSENCALVLVDGYLKMYKADDEMNVDIINSMDVNISPPDSSDELYIHLNPYLTKSYMDQYPPKDLRTKGLLSLPELTSIHGKIIQKCKDKQLKIKEEFWSV